MMQDALQQARSYSPEARFARALEGDTLEKLANMHNIPVEKLRLINRHRVGKSLVDREIFCLGWKYRVREQDTLATLAKRYHSKVSVIANLNDLATDVQLKPGQWIQVPGEFKYVAGQNGRQTYLQLGVYQQRNVLRDTPYDPKSQKIDIATLRQGEDLAGVAKRKKVTEEFLKTMNGLTDDDALQTGQRILAKYSVRPKNDATLHDIAQFFSIDVEDLLDVNHLARAEDMKPGEPIEIPMGERMNLSVQQPQDRNAGDTIFEVVLGENSPR
jgi:LysM repeat protein